MKTNAIVVNEYGGAENLQWQTIDLPECGDEEVLIDTKAIGFNMIDTYFRKGLYPAECPFIVGGESAGVIIAKGDKVAEFNVGDRVACVKPAQGAYAEQRLIPQSNLIKLPENISDEVAAASLIKGMTAQVLLKQCFTAKAGDTIVVYAASGGVGSFLVQWAKYLGVKVIAISGSAAKCEQAKANGADFTINMVEVNIDDIAAKVREYTKGQGVPVVYDSLGKETFYASLDCLQPRGLMVSYGNATGPVENVGLAELAQRGSLFVTRPMVFSYIEERETLQKTADEVFDLIHRGVVDVQIGQRFALKDAADAHKAAESRATQGSTILLP